MDDHLATRRACISMAVALFAFAGVLGFVSIFRGVFGAASHQVSAYGCGAIAAVLAGSAVISLSILAGQQSQQSETEE